ncbi:hypothetical protein K461DRAFT_265736 [Myriangium duriaei CBS 260.36]|uniref:Zn(2)-C6 fungal-type domain-containing protein n=1 Tax=Myriangium duriaei CBS 260.36 TaxID=1168546 RepID=A0A9P4J7T8_9PEZI|nr:hypothetical protein K461DRAFT_265736 [Myriangium duriaei CBS 260.36]
MVFTGKPSKACSRCRTRKLKCDLQRPSCRKCVLAGVACHGYRNELDLLFRDQTSSTVAKHKEPEPASHRNLEYGEVVSGYFSSSPTRPLDPKPVDVALAFFCIDYLRESNLEWMPALYTTTPKSSLLTQVMHATALAAFSFEMDEPLMYRQARKIYQESLIRLQSFVDSSKSIEDDVVASALLMSRFESLAKDSIEESITSSWASHVMGTFAIVNARSEAQNFGNPTAIALTEQVVLNYSNYCLSRGLRRPVALSRMCNRLRELFAGQPDLAVRDLRLQFHSFGDTIGKHRKHNLDHDKDRFSFETIQTATLFDLDMQNFMSELAIVTGVNSSSALNPSSQPSSVADYVAETPLYHVYKDHHEARIWNSCRMARLMAQDIIHDETIGLLKAMNRSPGSKNHATRRQLECLQQSSVSTKLQLSEDIFASAFQLLGGGKNNTSHAAASSLAWPLFIAGRTSRHFNGEFVKAQLSYIAKKFKVRSAQLAADNLDKKPYSDDWLVACALF